MHNQWEFDGRTRFIAPIFAVLCLVLLGCSGAGGKGMTARHSESVGGDSMDYADNSPAPERAEYPIPAVRMQTGQPSARDPFGLMPPDWPDDIPLHPASNVAYCGHFGTGGIYIVTLVSPDVATIPGIQTFHVESLSEWESLKVGEEPVDEEDGTDALTIVAERNGAYLRIVSQRATPGFVESLPNHAHWLEAPGPFSLVVRLYYMPLPPD